MMVMMWLLSLVWLNLFFLVPVNFKLKLAKPAVLSFLLRRLDTNRKKTPFPDSPMSAKERGTVYKGTVSGML